MPSIKKEWFSTSTISAGETTDGRYYIKYTNDSDKPIGKCYPQKEDSFKEILFELASRYEAKYQDLFNENTNLKCENDALKSDIIKSIKELLKSAMSNTSPVEQVTKKSTVKKPSKQFVKPTVEEIAAYCKEKCYYSVDPEQFFNFYESQGWKIGKNPMKKWKSAVATWNNREKSNKSDVKKEQEHSYDLNAIREYSLNNIPEFK